MFIISMCNFVGKEFTYFMNVFPSLKYAEIHHFVFDCSIRVIGFIPLLVEYLYVFYEDLEILYIMSSQDQ